MTAAIKLTELETKVMKAIPFDNFYEDGFESVLWSDIFATEVAELDSKKVRGVMTSLSKKNMIWVEKPGKGEERGTMGLTTDGIAWLTENCDFLDENGFVIKNSNNSNNEGEIVMNNEVENQVEEVTNAVEEVAVSELENTDVEIVSENEEVESGENETADEIEQTESENAAPQAVEAPTEETKRSHGIGVQWYINNEFKTIFPSIQAAARELKVYLQRDTMPYTIIHKSIREGISYTHPATNEVHVFHFENPSDKKVEYKTRVSKSSSSRGAGKLVDWFENGEFKKQFSSIKATVEYMKEYLKLPHNPYTAVLKSLNENQDFNQHSFKFATEVREVSEAVASQAVEQTVEAVEPQTDEVVEVEATEVELSENEIVEA